MSNSIVLHRAKPAVPAIFKEGSPLSKYCKDFANYKGWKGGEREFFIHEVVQFLATEIKEDCLWDWENPAYVRANHCMAKAIGRRVFKAKLLEDLVKKQCEDPPVLENGTPKSYGTGERVKANWRTYGGRIPRMVNYCKGVARLDRAGFPKCKLGRELSHPFRNFLNAMTDVKSQCFDAGHTYDFCVVWDHVEIYLKKLHSEFYQGFESHTVYDVEAELIGRYFGCQVLTLDQIKSLLIYEYMGFDKSDAVIGVPRHIKMDNYPQPCFPDETIEILSSSEDDDKPEDSSKDEVVEAKPMMTPSLIAACC